ncbi:MAG: TetR/AcrR family transcriptional regulator [Cellulomonas sp.]
MADVGQAPSRAGTGVSVDAARKGERTRDVILRRAVVHACTVGLAGLTISTIATAVGMSKSGMYAHFGSKEALQIAVLDAAAGEFSQSVVVPAFVEPRGEARVLALVDNWLTCGRTRQPGGCVIVKTSSELDDRPGPVRDCLRDHHLALDESIVRMVRGGIAVGQFRADADADQFAHDLYGVMLGYYHAKRLLADPLAEVRARRSVAALLDGLRVRASAIPVSDLAAGDRTTEER